jgi:hypothetical protein
MDLFLYTVRQVTRFDPLRMVPPLALLVVWMVFGHATILGASGFVWAVAALIFARVGVGILSWRWRVPDAEDLPAVRRALVPLALAGLLVCAGLVWLDDPLYAQRFATVYWLATAGLYLLYYLMSPTEISGLPLPWNTHPLAGAVVLPIEILILLSMAVANEAAISTGSLSLWVSARVLIPMVFYPVGHWIALLVLMAHDAESRD